MNIKPFVKIGTAIVTAIGIDVAGRNIKKVYDKRQASKKQTEINEQLFETYEAFRKEALKSHEAAQKAVKLMNNLQDEFDVAGLAIDPLTINTDIDYLPEKTEA